MRTRTLAVFAAAAGAAALALILAAIRFEPTRPEGSAHYRSETAPLKVSFDYPSSWRVLEDRGKIDPYAQVLLLGPRNAADTFTATFLVRGTPREKSGRFSGAEALARHYVEHLYGGKVEASTDASRVAGIGAREVRASYTVPPLAHKGLKAEAVRVKAVMLFFEKDGIVYETGYVADEREHARHASTFREFLKTLRLS